MKKYITILAILLAAVTGVYAQDSGTTKDAPKFIPEAGDFSGAILFGRGNYLDVAPAPTIASSTWTVSGSSPYANLVDPNENTIANMIGGEMRYFVTSTIALKLSGGAIMRNTPAQVNMPGIIDPNTPSGAWAPAYQAVVAQNNADVNINLGGEYHFATKYDRLSPWAGVTVPFYYGRRSSYDPTILDPDLDGNGGGAVDYGFRHTEQIGIGVQAAAGVDYYLMEGFYIGFEFKPISFIYAKSSKLPGAGLETLDANSTTVSFFSQPFFKIGFRF